MFIISELLSFYAANIRVKRLNLTLSDQAPPFCFPSSPVKRYKDASLSICLWGFQNYFSITLISQSVFILNAQ